MYSRRIVFTGLGAVTPLGHDVRELWDALIGGQSGVAPLRAFPVDGFRPAYAAEVKDFAPEHMGLARKQVKTMGRQAQLAVATALEAWTDADLRDDRGTVDPSRLGVVLGVGMLNADVTELGRAFHAAARVPRVNVHADTGANGSCDPVVFGQAGASELSPLWLLRHIPNLAAAHASIALDARGPSNTLTTGCVAAANAIGEAARIIARGEADVVLAGGTDARVSPLAMLRYRGLGWLATRHDIDPAAVSAPFDEDAAGFVNGEAAGIVVLEALEHARARGARAYAELVGYGAANDAYDVLRPHPQGRGLTGAILASLERSGLTSDDLDAVFAAAPSVPAFDRACASALTRVFSGCPRRPAITATRALLGHTHAASAALDCIAALKALEDSQLPPIINLRHPIADLPFVRGAARQIAMSTVLVAASGFGGHAAALVLRRYSA